MAYEMNVLYVPNVLVKHTTVALLSCSLKTNRKGLNFQLLDRMMKRGQKFFRSWHCVARSEGTEAGVLSSGLVLAPSLIAVL